MIDRGELCDINRTRRIRVIQGRLYISRDDLYGEGIDLAVEFQVHGGGGVILKL